MTHERTVLTTAVGHGLKLGDSVHCPDGHMRVVSVVSATTFVIRRPRWYDGIALWWGRRTGAKV